MAQYELYAGALRFSLPDDWQDHSIYSYLASEQPAGHGQAGFRSNIVTTREPRGRYEKVEEYAKDQLTAAKEQLPGLKIVEEGAERVATRHAYSRVFTFVAPPENIEVQQRQVFILSGDWVYTITFSTLPSHYAVQRDAFASILGQVTFS